MKREDISARVKVLLSDISGTPTKKINDDSRLYDVLGMDSLDIIELRMKIETDLLVTLDDYEINRFNSVQGIVGYVYEVMN